MNVGIITLTVVIISAYLLLSTNKDAFTPFSKETEKPRGSVKLLLRPNPYTIEKDAKTPGVNIRIESKENHITGAQIELQYDPKIITNVNIEPGSYLPNAIELFKTVDKIKGHVTYALGIPPNGTPKKGNGILAKITFSLVQPVPTQTDLTLVTGTAVTATESMQSVLTEKAGTTILFQ